MTCDKIKPVFYDPRYDCQGKDQLCDSNGSCCPGLGKIYLIKYY